MSNKVYDVSELNVYIKALLDEDVILSAVTVRGEISNYKMYPSGHHYFTLKDKDGSLRCVMFKGNASRLRFRPENGMKVLAFGRIQVYPRDGAYQLYVSELTPDGVGDLHVAYEQLKARLYEEGLFDERHKKPIPRYPGVIAVITSSAGAAVRDIIRVLGARWPLSKVVILPVRVQGEEAPPEIVGALRYANKYRVADLIITGRGGGSLEDLWAFNDERVARAIFASDIPVISAVGHEPDVTISDFVADLRAATPSNAAELSVPDRGEMRDTLRTAARRMEQAALGAIRAGRRRLEDYAGRRALRSPMSYVEDKRVELAHSEDRLYAAVAGRISASREGYIRLAASLDALSPLKVLSRGYAIVSTGEGKTVKRAKDVSPGDTLTIRLKKDEIRCQVI